MDKNFLKLVDTEKIVTRSRIDEEINKLMTFNKILYVYAQIGWGKTTTIIDYVGKSLDKWVYHEFKNMDNNPKSFLMVLIEIINSIENDINRQRYYNIIDRIKFFTDKNIHDISKTEEEVKRAVDKLCTCLKEDGARRIIILDDINRITNDFVKEILVYFIRLAPKNYKFILLSTREVPVCFSEFIISGDIKVLTSEQLAFNIKETNEFYIKEGIYLKEDEINEIFMNTGGWPAGMNSILIYLKLDRHRNIKKILENNHYINDFFNKSVWMNFDKRTKRFFMKISLFKGLYIDQCIEITGEKNSRELLEHLVKIEEDESYEPVPIFWDFIKTKSKSLSLENKIELYKKAGETFEKRNLNLEAAEYYGKAGDTKSEIRNLEKFCSKRTVYTDLSHMEKYIRKIPKDIVIKNPTLCTVMAILEITNYRGEIGEQWYRRLLDIREKLKIERSRIIEKKEKLIIEAEKIRDEEAFLYKNHEKLSECEKEVNKCEIEISKYDEDISNIDGKISYIYLSLPKTSNKGIKEEFNNQYENKNYNIKAVENISLTFNFPSMLSGIKDVSTLWNNYESMKEDLKERVTKVYGVGMEKIASGEVDYEKNQLNKALLKLTNAISKCSRKGHVDTLFVAYIILHKIMCANGYLEEAKRELNEIKRIIEEKNALYLMKNLNATYARFYLLNGDVRDAKNCISTDDNREMKFNAVKMYEYLTKARIYIAEKEYKRANGFLEILYRLNSEYECTRNVIECCILQAIALNKDGDEELALSKIGQALKFAEPLNYIRVFADEGEACHEILNKYLKKNEINKKASGDYIKKILLETRRFAYMYPKYLKGEDHICNVKITKSELQILRLIYKGMSNLEISDYLNIKKDTVKFHIKNIYSKLNVNNRIQAIKVAEELGIIEEKKIN